MRIAILGPGGVGGFLAAALWRAGEDVTLVGREATAELIAARGLRVRSRLLGEIIARPAVVARLDAPADVLVVATKAVGLGDALERVSGEPRLVVPLLNGLEHMTLLRERFGAGPVVAATIRIEADRPEPGVVLHSSPGVRVELASARAELRPALEDLAARLRGAEVPAELRASEAQVLWSKLVRLNALALATSAYDRPLGEVRADPQGRRDLEGAVDETAAVARAEGAEIDPAATMAELEQAHASLGSSLQRDIAAGRPTELDAIAGAVLRAARRHGLACPTVAALAARVAERAGVAPPAG